ncbi:calcium-binding protein [Angomonas deanei]|nr:calcium-binding protein [Angomonas deanei]|eukprot:EPY24675.1 calcium-binding protein [Angomonas deanei]
MDLKHFPAFPFDVYTKPDGDYYLTSDFQVDSVITLGGPQNQRDDDVKRFKIVSVDTEHLKTFHDDNNNSSIAKLQNTFLDTQGKRHEVAPLSGEAYDYLLMIRDAYILHVGGGVPEIGIKAMGRPFRKVSDDGRRWITRESMKILIRDARCFGSEAISFSSTNKSKKSVEEVSTLLYDAFPEEDGKGVDYDVFITAVRGEMNATRKDAVLHIFRSLDYDNDGLLKILDLQSTFNASEHPVVVADQIFSADKLLKGFIAIWDEAKKGHGTIPLSEFLDYYNGLSAVIEKDDIFLGYFEDDVEVAAVVDDGGEDTVLK